MLTRASRSSAHALISLALPVAAAVWAVLVLLLAPTSARAATFLFQSTFFTFNATGPALGTLVTAPGTGGPGDQILLAEIDSFEFSHTFAPGTTSVFETDDLVEISGLGLFVSADGLGLESGGWIAINGGDAKLRFINNPGDLNDNYLVDFPSATANGSLGGGFGGWVLVPEPGTALLLAAGLSLLAGRRRA